MRKLAIRLAVVTLSLIMLASMFGCTKQSTNNGKQKSNTGNVFRLSKPAKADSTKVLTTLIDCAPPPAFNGNPLDDTSGINWSIQPFMYGYLANYSPFPERKFKTELLEKYEFKDKVLTMTLKKGLKWSDGSQLTADDIMAHFYMNVGRSSVWTYIKSLEKVDELTVKISYVTNTPMVLNVTFNLPVATPAKIYGKWADRKKDVALNGREINAATGYYKFTTDGQKKLDEINKDVLTYKPKPEEAVCSGPYAIASVTTAEIMFKVNPNYMIKPQITKLRGLRPGSAEAFASSIMEGQYTVENGGLSPDMAKQVEAKYKDKIRKLYVPELSQIGYGFNIQKYPVSIPEVRKAISYATDRDTLLTIAEPGSFKSDWKNSGLLPSLQSNYTDKGFTDKLTDYSYNQKKAEELLKSIGWKKDSNGKWIDDKGKAVKLEIAVINSWPSFMYTGEAMSTMLKEFGFDVNFKPMDGGVIWKYLNSSDFMIGCSFLGGSSGYNTPWEAFNNIYSSSAARTGLPVLKEGEDRIMKDPVTNKEYNVTQMLLKLFNSTDDKEIKQLTEDFMTLTNDLCLYMPVIEKASCLRIYDQTLSLPEGIPDKIQKDYYYFGDINTALAKMIKDGQLYFTE
ncbi:MAG: ABC transporter substrate-binding protein [Clostridiales bacterium]|nr:ABC transporter substrate-binding protein [Clostridiales bacterium]